MEKITADYTFHHFVDKEADLTNYELHNHHDSYEIFIFLDGDAEFVVEGSIYPLKRYDTLLLNPNEFHHIRYRSPVRYERIVFHITNHFFTNNNCGGYRRMFDSKKFGTNNMIPASFITENGILEILTRTEKYAMEENFNILLNGTIIELLNALNKYHHSDTLFLNNAKITPIITYINENLTSPLTIDRISERFFINKYHLCRTFKKHTGLTINKYITHKRIILAKKLYSEGKTLSQAAIEAGFSNYSNFYKMYVNETGRSPRADMKRV